MQRNNGYEREASYHVKETLIPRSGPMRVVLIALPLTALILLTAVLVLSVTMSQHSRQRMLSPISEEEDSVYRIKNETPKDYSSYTVPYSDEDPGEEASPVQDREISPSVTETGLAEMISAASGVPEVRESNATKALDTPIDSPSTQEEEQQIRYLHLTSEKPDENLESSKNTESETAKSEKQESSPSNGESSSNSANEPKVEIKNNISDPLPLSAASGEKPFVQTWKQRWVAVDLANVREDASIDSDRLTQVIKGAVVTEIETNGDWSYVEVDPKCKGYIFSNLLSDEYVEPNEEEPEMIYSAEKLEEIQTPCDVVLYANASVVRIRKTPSLKGEIITDMYYGDYVHAVSYGYDWYKVELKGGKFGYVHGKYLQKEPIEVEDLLNNEEHQNEVIQNMESQGVKVGEVKPVAPPATVAPGAQGIVDLAMQYVGYPYVWGATGPNAFDCSGFVQFLHAQMGVSVGRTTYDQAYDGIDVPFAPDDFSHMLPGDIILLASGSDIYHSMIYIGNGQVIHAGTPATGVNIDNLAYYAHHMAYVKRIFY